MNKTSHAHITLLCMTGIILIAAIFRFIQLDYAPAGGHGDVSWIGINALDLVDRGVIPFYVRELYSPEFFPIYATGLITQLIGVSYLPQRIFTAIMGVLFVVFLYPMTYWLIGDDRSAHFRERAGLFAALAGALSLHVIGMNRLGMESPPFLTTIALLTWLTAQAWHQNGEKGTMKRWILAGAVLGLNQYIYLPARLLPISLALWMGFLLITQRVRFRASLRGWITMAMVSLIVTLPALIMFMYAPESFSGRADTGSASTGGWIWLYDTSAYGGALGLVLQKIGLTIQGILTSWHGAYGIMELPILSPLFALGFVIAVGLSVRSWRQIAFAWSWLAIPVMLITELISGAVLEVHALHQMGAVPFICVLSGLGLAWLWDKLRFQSAKWLQVGLRAALLIGLVVPSVLNMSYYLQTFISSQYTDPRWSWQKAQTDVDLGRYVSEHADQSFLLPYSEYTRSDVAWTLAAGFRNRTSAINADGMLAIENPPNMLTVIHMADPDRPRHDGYASRSDDRLWVLLHDNTVYLLPPLRDDQVRAVLGDGIRTPLIDASGTQVIEFVSLPTPSGLLNAHAVIDHPIDATFNDQVRLVGYSAPVDELEAGMNFHVTLYWQALEMLPVDYEVFAQLWTDDAQAIAISHVYPFSGMYRSRMWRTDEIIATHHYLEVPEDAPAGRYTLVGGMFRYLLNESVPVAGENAESELQVTHLTPFRIPLISDKPEASPVEPIAFGEQIQIRGWEIDQADTLQQISSIHRGENVDVRVTWEAITAIDADYSVFIHLTKVGDEVPTVQVDHLIGDTYPTSIWEAGERITSSYRLNIPEDIDQGQYRLTVGVYHWVDGTRLTLADNTAIYPLAEAIDIQN